jgi:hypothetical protein
MLRPAIEHGTPVLLLTCILFLQICVSANGRVEATATVYIAAILGKKRLMHFQSKGYELTPAFSCRLPLLVVVSFPTSRSAAQSCQLMSIVAHKAFLEIVAKIYDYDLAGYHCLWWSHSPLPEVLLSLAN